MLYGSDERFSGSECLALEARLKVRRKFVRAHNVARVARPLGAFGGPMPRMSVLRSIIHRDWLTFISAGLENTFYARARRDDN
jgi:hypothetical protein